MRAVGIAAAAMLIGPTPVEAQPGTKHGLASIALTPAEVRRSVGDVQYLTAMGRFADGNFRNITQRVEYRSSNPKVAEAKNERGVKSRIDLVGLGRATISAVDPLTGVTSSDTGGDVAVHVVAALERITLKPTEVQRAVGEFQHFTVTGHYPGGVTRNLTQQSKYRSSDPRVAHARNQKGDKSRVEAVGPGTATISAFHPLSGLSSDESGTSATFTVLGALERITLGPPHPRRALGDPQRYTATGHYAGGVTRNLTQQVEYATSDASIASAPNAEGDRSRIETLALGSVTISARDPTSGISSSDAGGDVQLTVYDPAAPKREAGETAPTRERRPVGASETAPTAGPPALGVSEAAPTGERPALGVCGDASGDGALGVSDPLWILAGVVGAAACPLAVCDVDADGVVATSDAITVGWVVAGTDAALRCRRAASP